MADFIRTWDGRRLDDWGCSVSKEFKQFQGAMKREVKRLAEAQGATLTSWSNGHYDMTGVLERNGLYVYFHYSNLDRTKVALTHKYDEWLGCTLMRTMKHAKDWTGGTNHHIEFERFTETMEYLFKQQQPAAVQQVQTTQPEIITTKNESTMASSKIQSYNLYVAIKPYKLDGINDEFNEVSVTVSYDDRHHQFDVLLHAGWGNGSWHGCTLWDGRGWLTDTQWVPIKDAPRNSQKTINEMGAALELAKDDIAWLFNERKFEELEQLVKDVALYGYTATIEERMKGYKNEAMVKDQVEAGRKAEPRDNSQFKIQNPETTMEAKDMKAADFIGKTIIVGENIATITINGVDGETLQGEFKKTGTEMGMYLPIALAKLQENLSSGAWKLDEPAAEATGTEAAESELTATTEDAEFADYEEVTEESEASGLAMDNDSDNEIVNGKSVNGKSDDDPVLQQWREAKAKSPDAVIIFRNGGAYVVLADDAEKVAEVAGLSLTHSNGTAICVFPTTELSVVLPKIVRAGIRTAIADLRPTPDPSRDGGEQAVAEQPKPRRVQPKAARVEEEEPSEEPEGAVTEEPAEDVVVEPSGKPEGDAQGRVQPKRASECTLEAKRCAPYIIDQGGSCVYVGGNTEKLQDILYLMWGRKRAYQEGDNKYSGVQVSRKHKKMLEAILKIA